MLNKNEGFLLLESMIAMMIISLSILSISGGIVFLLNQEKESRDRLETAIFMDELVLMRNKEGTESWVKKKAQEEGLSIIKWEEGRIELEKNAVQLNVYKK